MKIGENAVAYSRPLISELNGVFYLDGERIPVTVDVVRKIVRIGCTEITFFAFERLVNRLKPHICPLSSDIITIQE